MTGAPKLRSVTLLEELEGHPRGPYSGCLGFFGIDGSVKMNVIIRTAVIQGDGDLSIGAGGAITTLSDPASELAEVETKANSVIRIIENENANIQYFKP